MGFKMKGHALKGPYQQKQEGHQVGDIEKAGQTGEDMYNQEIDTANEDKVLDMRQTNITDAEQSQKDFQGKVQAHIDAGNTLSEEQANQANTEYERLGGLIDSAYDDYNYSADSINVSNQNARNRADQAFDAIFKQKSRGDERRYNRAGKKRDKAKKKINKAGYAIEEANQFMLENTRPGKGPQTGERVYSADDKKTKRKIDRKYAKAERKSKRADRAIGRANKAISKYNRKLGK